jgi:putative DNA primase/helicase
VVPFFRSFVSSPSAPHERPLRLGIDDELRAEASGILAWLVKGALLYQQSGLTYPDKVVKAKDEYKEAQDELAGWIEDAVDLKNEAVETFKDLYRNYAEWYEKNVSAKNVPKSTKLGSLLVKRFERTTKDNARAYKGLRLK